MEKPDKQGVYIKGEEKYIRSETSMEKNRIRPINSGKSMRMSYSRQKEVLQMPNLIEVQKDSYKWFLDLSLIHI